MYGTFVTFKSRLLSYCRIGRQETAWHVLFGICAGDWCVCCCYRGCFDWRCSDCCRFGRCSVLCIIVFLFLGNKVTNQIIPDWTGWSLISIYSLLIPYEILLMYSTETNFMWWIDFHCFGGLLVDGGGDNEFLKDSKNYFTLLKLSIPGAVEMLLGVLGKSVVLTCIQLSVHHIAPIRIYMHLSAKSRELNISPYIGKDWPMKPKFNCEWESFDIPWIWNSNCIIVSL